MEKIRKMSVQIKSSTNIWREILGGTQPENVGVDVRCPC